MGQTIKNQLSSFGNWVTTSLLPSLLENWKFVWLAISLGGTIVTAAYDYMLTTTVLWVISAVLAGITAGSWWKNVRHHVGQALKSLFKKIWSMMSGSYGLDIAALTITMSLGSLAALLQAFPGMCPEPVEIANMSLPLSGWLFTGAVLTGVAIIPLFIKRLVK